MSEPWLSVVMPTYNGVRMVGDALTSIAAANDPGIEVVVVDDGSTDDTLGVVGRYGDTLRLRVQAGPRRGNWVAATNEGLRAATGELVCFLHQDDRWLPGRLDAIRALRERHPGAALHVHAATFAASDGRPLGRWSLPFRGVGAVDGDSFVERLLVQNFLCVAAPAFHRADALAGGGLDESLWYTADWDLWLRLAASGDVAYDERPLVAFRVHEGSQTARRSDEDEDFRRQLATVLDAHLPPWAARHPAKATAVDRAAHASLELNLALARASHGHMPSWRPLLSSLVASRPSSLRRLVRDARLHERVGARLRARVARAG